MRYVAAIDVGGTFIKAALVSENLEIIENSSTDTPKNDLTGEATADAIAELVRGFETHHPVDAVGFAVLSMRCKVSFVGLAISSGKTFPFALS